MTENRSKTVVIIALCLTLIFMGVGFAALTERLEINTNGTVAASTWKVELTNWTHVEGQKVGGEQVTASVSDVSTTAVTLNFNLSKPGDKVVFTGNIHNGGTLNAKLNKAVEISEYFGEDRTVKRTVEGAPTAEGTMLAVNQTVPVTITYEFVGETLPEGELELEDTIVFDYIQAD